METYFDLIPQELINEILVKLEKNDLTEYEELFKINYEHLMILKYREFHQDIKNLMKFDKNLQRYNQSWKLIYMDSDSHLGESLDYAEYQIYELNSVYVDLVFSIKLWKKFKNMYFYKYFPGPFYEGLKDWKTNGFISPYFTYLLYKCFIDNLYYFRHKKALYSIGFTDFVESGILTKDITYQELYNTDIVMTDFVIFTFILYGNPNFKCTPVDIEKLEGKFDKYTSNNFTEFVTIYRNIIENLLIRVGL